MTANYFPINDALKILQENDLLSGALVPASGSLVKMEPDGIPSGLQGKFLGARLDSRHLKKGELFVALKGEYVDGRKFVPQVLGEGNWVLAALSESWLQEWQTNVSANIKSGIILSNNPESALAILGSAWRKRQSIKVVGITGTNGKTTTKDLLAAMLGARGTTLATAGNFNNHLGLPLTLLNIRPEHEFAVVEMGASAVGEINFLAGLAAPDVGIITNASEAHLAEFGSLNGIVQGKGELLDNLPASGLAILNADSPGFQRWSFRASCQVASFGQDAGDYRWSLDSSLQSSAQVTVSGVTFPVPLPGLHNGANLVAALLAARHLELSDQEIRSGLQEFQGSPHRGVLLTIDGRKILDDCYNANPNSMLAAVTTLLEQSLDVKHLAVLGHMAELGKNATKIHQDVGTQLAALGLKNLVVVGEDAKPLLVGFDESGNTGHYCSTLEAAADYVANNSSSGDCILIKGSRSAAMENILPLLQEKLDTK